MKAIIDEELLADDQRLLTAINKVATRLGISVDKSLGFILDEHFKIRGSMQAEAILRYKAGALEGKPLAGLLRDIEPRMYAKKAWPMVIRYIRAGKAHCFTRLGFITYEGAIFPARCIFSRLTDNKVMVIAASCIGEYKGKEEANGTRRAFAELKDALKRNPNTLTL